jgi:hypothetical protein
MQCEICGSDSWTQLRGGWVRCNVCGRLETTIEAKKCRMCDKDLGKYSKKNQKLCVECRATASPEEFKVNCSTKGCLNKIVRGPNPNKMCRQCVLENKQEEGLHLWKSFAVDTFDNDLTRKKFRELIQKKFPLIGYTSIDNWVRKFNKSKTLDDASNKSPQLLPTKKFVSIKVTKHKPSDN